MIISMFIRIMSVSSIIQPPTSYLPNTHCFRQFLFGNAQEDKLTSKLMKQLANVILSDLSQQWPLTHCELVTPSHWPLSGWPSHWPAYKPGHQIFVIFVHFHITLVSWCFILIFSFLPDVNKYFSYPFNPASSSKEEKVVQPYQSWFKFYKCACFLMSLCVWRVKGLNVQTCLLHMWVFSCVSECQERISPSQCQWRRKSAQPSCHVNHKSLSYNGPCTFTLSLKNS